MPTNLFKLILKLFNTLAGGLHVTASWLHVGRSVGPGLLPCAADIGNVERTCDWLRRTEVQTSEQAGSSSTLCLVS